MNFLADKITKEGLVIDESILKVNHFINQQVEPEVLRFVGLEFAKYFKEKNINKILTIEASGIAFAIATAFCFGDIPIVFAKKGQTKLSDNNYQSDVYSFTRQQSYQISVDKRLLSEKDEILIIDDFLANGNAMKGLLEICEQANTSINGIGIVIEKTFQSGRKKINDLGYDVYSLVKINSLKGNKIVIEE